MYEEIFKNRLSQLRTKKGVSARDMSLSLGQNSGYINHIENGQALPSMTGFFNICEYFNISPQEFFDTSSSNPALLSNITDDLKELDNRQLVYLSKLIADLAHNGK